MSTAAVWRWRIVLSGDRAVLDALTEWFAGPDLAVVREDREYHLVSEGMQVLGDLKSANERGRQLLTLLNFYAHLADARASTIAATATIETSGNTHRRYAHICASASSSYGYSVAEGHDPLRQSVVDAKTTQRLSQAFLTDDNVRLVLEQWLRYLDEGTTEPCLATRRMLEVLGGKKWGQTVCTAGWATSDEVTALNNLLYDERLSGHKRLHGYRQRDTAPAGPADRMTFGGARALVQRIVMRYLVSKAEKQP